MKKIPALLKQLPSLLFAALLFASFNTGCSNDGPTTENPPHDSDSVAVSGKFLTLSDIHFNPYADTTLVLQLAHTDVSGWKAIFEKAPAQNYGAYGYDSDYQLMSSAFTAMHNVNAHPDFIVITGDFLGHDFESLFTQYTGSSNTDSLHAFIKKTIEFMAMELKASFPGTPIYPVLGNNDDYCGDYMIQPNSAFLAMFADTWTPFLASTKGENTFAKTVPPGGYFETSLPGFPDHVMIGLNTIFFSPKETSTCQTPDTTGAGKELDWLRQTLESCRQQKKKAWFACHIPPGADVYSATHGKGPCSTHIKMMWKQEYSDAFLALENEYQDVINGGFAGHTHMDDFRVVQDAGGKACSYFHINPAVSPIFGNNPGFQQFTYDAKALTLLDYETYVFQGLAQPGNTNWTLEYNFGKTYNVQAIDANSLSTVWQAIATDSTVRMHYIHYYSMGSASAEPTPWGPYWCGIGDLKQTDFSSCACKK